MFIGVYNKSVFFSFLGLLFSILSCIFLINGNIKLSMFFFMLIGLIDMLDGRIANMTKRTKFEKKFGIQIDTILDVFNFSAIPLAIIYLLGFTDTITIIFSIFYVFTSIMRLAYFNTLSESGNDPDIYYGIPTTTISLYLPLMVLLYTIINNIWVIRIMLFIISISYIINIKIIKPHSLKFYLSMISIGLLILLGIIFIL